MLRTISQPDRYYVDASLFITKMERVPYVQSKTIEEISQAFQVSVQATGHRVLERLVVRIRIHGEDTHELGYLFGYTTHRLAPIVFIDAGEVVEVCTELRQARGWWSRLTDRFWDWWTPPKARVLIVGVVRKGEN